MGEWAGWGSGSSGKAVVMTEDNARRLVDAIIDGVSRASNSELMQQYQRAALQEAELREARMENERLARHIGQLEAHIVRLNNFLAGSMAPTAPTAPMISNNNGTGFVPPVTSSIPYTSSAAPPLAVPPYNPLVD